MGSEEHDSKLAELSHLPHLVSSVLAHSLSDKTNGASMISGQGLRDTIRIAGGSPDLWTGIIQQNQINVLESLKNFEHSLKLARDLISEKKYNGLKLLLEQGAEFQKNLNK